MYDESGKLRLTSVVTSGEGAGIVLLDTLETPRLILRILPF